MAPTLKFSRPVTPAEASKFLFGTQSQSSRILPLASTGDATEHYALGTADLDLLAQMRPDVFHALMVAGAEILRSNAKPWADMPKWVPPEIQKDIKTGKVAKGATRYKRKDGWGKETEAWGDIIVWRGNSHVELYWEFPANPEFYERIADGDSQRARLLHFAYTQYNKDLSHFVETKGLSIENARAEIRKINEELFKLIIEGAAAILASGAGITQVQNAMRQSSRQVADAARRMPRPITPKIRPSNGKINVGGAGEYPGATNLNPLKPSGPSKGIPNHVEGAMEQMDEIFEHGSCEFLLSNKLPYVAVNWRQGAAAAARVMRPGGKVSMNVWLNSADEAAAVKAAFEAAGFKDVTVIGDGFGTVITAVR